MANKKTSDYLNYEATLATSWLLHAGQKVIVLPGLSLDSIGTSKIVLHFLQWNRLICYSFLMSLVINSYIIFQCSTINIITINIILVNYNSFKSINHIFGGFN
jgi:hypothetical protein